MDGAPDLLLSDRATQTRRAILDAARECFAERGPSGASLRTIARRAGVTQPLIHHYFGTKDALFAGVLEDAVADYEALQSEQWALPSGDPRFLTRGLVLLFLWLGRNPQLQRLVTWARLEGRDMQMASATAIFERVQQQLHDSTVLREGVDIDAAILMIDALFKGYWELRPGYAQSPIDTKDLDARVLRTSLDVMLRGLIRPEALDDVLALAHDSLSAHLGQS